MQSFNGRYGIAAENEVVSKCLHCQYANVVFQENRQDLMLKAAELVAVHNIERELDRFKTKAIFGSRLQHPEMHEGIFVPVESNMAYFAGLFRLQDRFLSTSFGEGPVWGVSPND